MMEYITLTKMGQEALKMPDPDEAMQYFDQGYCDANDSDPDSEGLNSQMGINITE